MRLFLVALMGFCFCSCTQTTASKREIKPENILTGTWKMVYAEIHENDSLKIKDLNNTSFIKIINDTHFAFFNQENNSTENFYGGAGSYLLKGDKYTETLNFTSIEAIKGHEFSFTIDIKGDSLIQSGTEKVEKSGIYREIVEKYVRIK